MMNIDAVAVQLDQSCNKLSELIRNDKSLEQFKDKLDKITASIGKIAIFTGSNNTKTDVAESLKLGLAEIPSLLKEKCIRENSLLYQELDKAYKLLLEYEQALAHEVISSDDFAAQVAKSNESHRLFKSLYARNQSTTLAPKEQGADKLNDVESLKKNKLRGLQNGHHNGSSPHKTTQAPISNGPTKKS